MCPESSVELFCFICDFYLFDFTLWKIRKPFNLLVSDLADVTMTPQTNYFKLRMVQRHRKLPESYIRFFQALYHNACAVVCCKGALIVILRFFSGVLQGCPSSAMLFDLALDPFLIMFARVLEHGRLGIVRACADDIL